MPRRSAARVRAGLLTAAGGFLLSAAQADTQVLTYTLNPQTTDFNQPFTLGQFDPSLGTLTGAALTLSGSGTMQGTVTNGSTASSSVTLSEESDFQLTSPALAAVNLTGALTETETFSDLAGGATGTFGAFSPAFGPVTQSYSPADAGFSAFEGVGTLPFELDTLTGSSLTGTSGDLQQSLTTVAGGTATVTYTYIPAVPEASSVVSFGLLLALGLGGATLARRKRPQA